MKPNDNTSVLAENENFQAKTDKNSIESVCFEQKSVNLDINNEKTDYMTPEAQKNMQKSADFPEENSQIINSVNTVADRVSEFNTHNSIENSSQNTKILSNDEDNALFSRLFPGVKRENVEKDPNFRLFSSGKDKNKSFCSLYGEYLALVGKIREEITMRSVVAMKNKLSSPGSLSSEENPESAYLTREQVLKMSKEQIARNYEKIRESQQKW